jgi:hypothetical protein
LYKLSNLAQSGAWSVVHGCISNFCRLVKTGARAVAMGCVTTAHTKERKFEMHPWCMVSRIDPVSLLTKVFVHGSYSGGCKKMVTGWLRSQTISPSL